MNSLLIAQLTVVLTDNARMIRTLELRRRDASQYKDSLYDTLEQLSLLDDKVASSIKLQCEVILTSKL